MDEVIKLYSKYLIKLHAAGSIKDSTLTDYNKRLNVLCDYMQKHTLPIMYIYQFNLSYISDFLDYLLLDVIQVPVPETITRYGYLRSALG